MLRCQCPAACDGSALAHYSLVNLGFWIWDKNSLFTDGPYFFEVLSVKLAHEKVNRHHLLYILVFLLF